MQRKLVPSGTGWKLYMLKDILRLLGVNPAETKVLFKVDKNVLKISKIESDFYDKNLLIKKLIKLLRSNIILSRKF